MGHSVLPDAAEDGQSAADFARAAPGYRIQFPADTGSHPRFGIEWWYITGWLYPRPDRPLGFQITFFRARSRYGEGNPSAFAPRQIVIGHAALSDPSLGRLVHAQRAARAAFGLAGAAEGATRVWLDTWLLEAREGSYHAVIPADEFRYDLTFMPSEPPLLHGENGYSRKGSDPRSASYYYSLPQLTVRGTLGRGGSTAKLEGSAWLDHEWSSSYMAEGAVGWDWVGINFVDGSALMAFRMRSRNGAALWASATLRAASGADEVFPPSAIRFEARRTWRSPRTGTDYTVSWMLRVGTLQFEIEPLMDDQEQDVRASTGTIYWEGAVRAHRGSTLLGHGYLELTGYWRRMDLSQGER